MDATRYSALSDVGCERSENQDRWGADADQRLFMVADGVGGSRDGALAAQTMVDILPRYVAHHLPPDQREAPDAPERLGRAISELSDDLHTKAQKDARYAGANSTLVAIVVVGARVLVAHLGDSRAYLYREGQLTQLTKDHTLVQSLVDANQVQAEDAGNLRVRNVVTRYMGMKPPRGPTPAPMTCPTVTESCCAATGYTASSIRGRRRGSSADTTTPVKSAPP